MITNMPKLFSEFDLAAYKQAMRKAAVKVEHRRDDARVEGQGDIEDVQDVDDEGDFRVCWELAIRLVIMAITKDIWCWTCCCHVQQHPQMTCDRHGGSHGVTMQVMMLQFNVTSTSFSQCD